MTNAERGMANVDRGRFGELWLRTVVSGFRLSHGVPDEGDMLKADLSITLPREEVAGLSNAGVWVQVKTTIEAMPSNGDGALYDLDVKTYDVLRRGNNRTRRVLVVFWLTADDNVSVQSDMTALIGSGLWASLEGQPPTDNKETIRVELPHDNVLDRDGLLRMLKEYGVPSTSKVPAIDLWEVPGR